jgi:hypothetical protein
MKFSRQLSVSFVPLLMGAAIVSVGSGCGQDRGPQRVVVSGTVNYHGQPVAEGRIRFTPLTSSSLPVSGAFIIDGRYRVDGHGGVPVGTHKVQIEAYTPTDPAMLPDLSGERTRPSAAKTGLGSQYLPRKFNVDSQLQVTIEPDDRSATKDFDLTD